MSVSPCIYKVGDHFPKIPYKKIELALKFYCMEFNSFLFRRDGGILGDTRGHGRFCVAACGVGGPAVGSVWGNSPQDRAFAV